MPESLIPIVGRFFARIRSVEMACPRCGEVTVIPKLRTRWVNKGVYRASLTWNPQTQAWRCPECGLKLALGIIAYFPPGSGNQHTAPEGMLPPLDTIPTPSEAKNLRAALEALHAKDGILANLTRKNRESTNRKVQEKPPGMPEGSE